MNLLEYLKVAVFFSPLKKSIIECEKFRINKVCFKSQESLAVQASSVSFFFFKKFLKEERDNKTQCISRMKFVFKTCIRPVYLCLH